jgi:hypothetical protein
MDVELVEGSDPPGLEEFAAALVALGYPEWVRDCARASVDDDGHAVTFELACKHEGTVSAIRKVGARGAYVECTRCACRIFDEDGDLWASPPRHGWATANAK